MIKKICLALLLLNPSLLVQAQLSGVGLSAISATGYGLYVVTMRPSAEAGAISSFYLYSHNGAWPSRWYEIDFEFTPGFVGTDKIDDPFNPGVVATGKSDQQGCFSQKSADSLPLNKSDCVLTPIPSTSAGNSYISLNVYNHRAWDGYLANGALVYPHSSNQVFVPSNAGSAIFTKPRTYLFYYTPNGIYWSKDLPVIPLAKDQLPSQALLKSPIAFVKKDIRVVNANRLWSPGDHAIDQVPGTLVKAPDMPLYEAFAYDSKALTPLLEDKKTLAENGTLMYLSMNLWDGSCKTKDCRAWGGPKAPDSVKDASEYYQVAYYPLKTPVALAAKALDPSQLRYDKPALYSDFAKGIFLLNQQTIAFSKLWQVTDNTAVDPLGRLDERNLSCGFGKSLKMSLTEERPVRQTSDRASLQACPWLLDNS